MNIVLSPPAHLFFFFWGGGGGGIVLHFDDKGVKKFDFCMYTHVGLP